MAVEKLEITSVCMVQATVRAAMIRHTSRLSGSICEDLNSSGETSRSEFRNKPEEIEDEEFTHAV